MLRYHFVIIAALILITVAATAQENKLGLPNPDKPDVPYIIHASNILATEVNQATQTTKKNEVYYTVPGAGSPVSTPLASPEFLFLSENISPTDLTLFKLTPKNGQRELLFQKKKKILAEQIRLDVFPVEENLSRVRVDESLPSGEYCLTPNGSNAVFCFNVF